MSSNSIEAGIQQRVTDIGEHVPQYVEQQFAGKRSSICVVIPVINEGDRIQSLLLKINSLGLSQSFDVIIVDGGSTDGSLDPAFLQGTHVRTLLTKTGPGKLSAQLRCGYWYCLMQGYQGIITIDGNNKDDPSVIPKIARLLSEGYDFVQASRFVPGGAAINTPASRNLAIRLVHAPMLSLSSGFSWTDTTQGFRGYSSRVLSDSRVAPFRGVFNSYELLAYLSARIPRLGYKCIETPSTRTYPKGKIPTKIGGIRGELKVLGILLAACYGRFNPR